MLDLSLSLHNVRLIKPDSEGEVHDLIVRIFISFFVFFLLSRSHVTFSKQIPLACFLKSLVLN